MRVIGLIELPELEKQLGAMTTETSADQIHVKLRACNIHLRNLELNLDNTKPAGSSTFTKSRRLYTVSVNLRFQCELKTCFVTNFFINHLENERRSYIKTLDIHSKITNIYILLTNTTQLNTKGKYKLLTLFIN